MRLVASWFEAVPSFVGPQREERRRSRRKKGLKGLEGKRTEPGRVWKRIGWWFMVRVRGVLAFAVHGSWFEFVVWWCVGS